MIKSTEGAQFIIATHSPILMSYPEAQIMFFDDDGIQETSYSKVDHVDLYRRFLSNPKNFLDRLLAD